MFYCSYLLYYVVPVFCSSVRSFAVVFDCVQVLCLKSASKLLLHLLTLFLWCMNSVGVNEGIHSVKMKHMLARLATAYFLLSHLSSSSYIGMVPIRCRESESGNHLQYHLSSGRSQSVRFQLVTLKSMRSMRKKSYLVNEEHVFYFPFPFPLLTRRNMTGTFYHVFYPHFSFVNPNCSSISRPST